MTAEQHGDREARIDRAIGRKIVRKSKNRVRSKVGFIWHFSVFLAVNLALLAINLTYSHGYLWFIWPLVAWGAGLSAHAMAVFLFTGTMDAMVAREIEKEKLRRGVVSKAD